MHGLTQYNAQSRRRRQGIWGIYGTLSAIMGHPPPITTLCVTRGTHGGKCGQPGASIAGQDPPCLGLNPCRVWSGNLRVLSPNSSVFLPFHNPLQNAARF